MWYHTDTVLHCYPCLVSFSDIVIVWFCQLYNNRVYSVGQLYRGVNLPGHTVIIKGTEIYEPDRGGFVDVSILDVMQIFGRAGRPQYDKSGHALLLTAHDKLNNYLGMLVRASPMESSFIKALPDHLNAEIVNGTITNIKEASAWLSYTFLYMRMKWVMGLNMTSCLKIHP